MNLREKQQKEDIIVAKLKKKERKETKTLKCMSKL